MNTDFGTYIKELVKKFSENGISADEKSLQYGCQLVLAKGADKAVLSVYNGKKGIKFVWNGKNAAFTQTCKDILADGSSTGTNYCLLKDLPEFNGIWAGSDESGKGDFFGPLVVAAVAAACVFALAGYRKQVSAEEAAQSEVKATEGGAEEQTADETEAVEQTDGSAESGEEKGEDK